MCFAPADETAFFEALRAGLFDVKAVCSSVDARRATASVATDKTMITDSIISKIGLSQYNDRLRTFLEEQYRLVATRGGHEAHAHSGGGGGSAGYNGAGLSGGRGGDSGEVSSFAGADDFMEVLKHLRRMKVRLEEVEKRQKEVARRQEEATREVLEAVQRGASGK
jgi:hypothetical protein